MHHDLVGHQQVWKADSLQAPTGPFFLKQLILVNAIARKPCQNP